MEAFNVFLLVIAVVLIVAVAILTLKYAKLKAKNSELSVGLWEAEETISAQERQLSLEKGAFMSRLEQINMPHFGDALWDDQRFIAAVRNKVDEARPSALVRCNRRQEAEMQAKREKDEADAVAKRKRADRTDSSNASSPSSSSSYSDTSTTIISMIAMDSTSSM